VANSNRRKNFIESLLVSSVSYDQTKIREYIVQFYDSLFTKQFSWRSKLDELAFNNIEEEEASWLE
jgi:hypothetical protein